MGKNEEDRKKKRNKRANGEGGIYKKGPYWEAVVTKGYDSNGKQLFKYFSAKTQQEVAKKLRDYITDTQRGTYIEPTKITVGEWLDYWYKSHVIDIVKIKTRCDYESSIRCYIKPHLGGIKLTELKGMQIQEFYNNLLKNGSLRKKGGLSPKTVRNIHVAFHRALEQAVNDDLIMKNPLRGVTLPSQKGKPIEILTKEEQKKLVDNCGEHPWEMAILLTLYSGMRLGEVTGLTWEDINFESNCIRINKQVGRVQNFTPDAQQKTKLCLRKETKTSSSNRTISIAPVIIERLKEHKTRQDKHITKLGDIYNNLNMVFCREDGNLIDPKTFRTFFINTLDKAGIAKKKFHALRHTFATRALESGINPKTVSQILGHASIKMTLDTYSHVSPELQQEAMQKIVDNFYI